MTIDGIMDKQEMVAELRSKEMYKTDYKDKIYPLDSDDLIQYIKDSIDGFLIQNSTWFNSQLMYNQLHAESKPEAEIHFSILGWVSTPQGKRLFSPKIEVDDDEGRTTGFSNMVENVRLKFNITTQDAYNLISFFMKYELLETFHELSYDSVGLVEGKDIEVIWNIGNRKSNNSK